jgi:hypothetical protein
VFARRCLVHLDLDSVAEFARNRRKKSSRRRENGTYLPLQQAVSFGAGASRWLCSKRSSMQTEPLVTEPNSIFYCWRVSVDASIFAVDRAPATTSRIARVTNSGWSRCSDVLSQAQEILRLRPDAR